MIKAIDLIKKHEGVRLKVYKDTTGHDTIGYGRNLDFRGISMAEAEVMLQNDIAQTVRTLEPYTWYQGLDATRQAVLVDMAFNLGVKGLLGFTTFLNFLLVRDFAAAADDMLATKWARQVGHRAIEDAEIIREGSEVASD